MGVFGDLHILMIRAQYQYFFLAAPTNLSTFGLCFSKTSPLRQRTRRRLGGSKAQSTYIPRVPQCLSLRPNWDSPTPSPANECAPPSPHGTKEGTHSPVGEGLGGSRCGRLEKKLSTQSTYYVTYGMIEKDIQDGDGRQKTFSRLIL